MNPTFSISESLKFGWEKTKENSGLLLKVVLTLFVLEMAQGIFKRVLEHTAIGGLVSLAFGIAGFVVGVGLTLIALRIAQGKHTEYKDIIPPLGVLWRYFLASLLLCLIFLGIMILLLIPFGIYAVHVTTAQSFGTGAGALPGLLILMFMVFVMPVYILLSIYPAIRFSMYRFAVLDGMSARQSLKKSSEITRGVKWHLLGFILVLILVNILGVMALLVGLLVTIPVTLIASAHVYQKLLARAQGGVA